MMFIATAMVFTSVVGCSNSDDQPSVTMTLHEPESIADVARVSAVTIEGRVLSPASMYEILPDSTPAGADPEESPPAPQVFAYEVTDVLVTRVRGRAASGRTVPIDEGDTIAVGVPVLNPNREGNVSSEDVDSITPPGETFEVGATGIWFLTSARPLGEFGEGYEAVGFAMDRQPGRAEVRAVFGPLRGQEIARERAAAAAENPGHGRADS